MKHTVIKSYVMVFGKAWMPQCPMAQEIKVSQSRIDDLRGDDGLITRESVELWLTTHTGDFSSVDDFYADIEAPEGNVIIEWESEDIELMFSDLMHGEDDY